ncbi:MAG: putative peptidase membrane zinc metallopeptidase [Puniceicoccaceae bacterium 5H]|nr:MAG: putative peptidase membrane zinc metallopeptidase [Puniceicoccaceae bacterium 5H]
MMLYLILVVPTIFLGMWAQSKVMGAYKKWSKVGNRRGMTGYDAARIVMERAGIHDVEIVPIRGQLSDHYDPTSKRLALSEQNYHGRSLAAVGIAAHEAGHAIQHATGYSMLKLRMGLVPVTTFASKMLPFVLLGGIFFHMTGLITLGVLAYLVLTIFQLVTLPVEFDASKRAKAQLVNGGILYDEEMEGVNDTLDSAAWTYVAAFIASLANLIYLFLLSRD